MRIILISLLCCFVATGTNTAQKTTLSDEILRIELEAPDMLPSLLKSQIKPLPNFSEPIPIGLQSLAIAYPDFIECVDHEGLWFFDGTYMPYDDGEQKHPDTILVRPDLQDMMSIAYRGKDTPAVPTEKDEAGRIRYEPFFKKMYGGTEQEVRANLKPITWLPGVEDLTLRVNRKNGAADSLQIISNELAALPEAFHKYLRRPAGVFNWRTVSGSSRMSMHSFAIAVDINTKYADYWDWSKDANGNFSYRNRIPSEIVEIFERHGYIWGGRWLHHDTMHFEFRPELLMSAIR
jgi:hypothetical protein